MRKNVLFFAKPLKITMSIIIVVITIIPNTVSADLLPFVRALIFAGQAGKAMEYAHLSTKIPYNPSECENLKTIKYSGSGSRERTEEIYGLCLANAAPTIQEDKMVELSIEGIEQSEAFAMYTTQEIVDKYNQVTAAGAKVDEDDNLGQALLVVNQLVQHVDMTNEANKSSFKTLLSEQFTDEVVEALLESYSASAARKP